MYELHELPVSIDLETAGLSPNAPILSIGAVRFVKDPSHMVLSPPERHEFQVAIDLQGQAPIDPSTFYWWLGQSREAQQAVLEGKGGLSLGNALRALWQWLQADSTVVGRESNFTGELWIRGDRDSCWLEEAHKREGIKPGYRFSKVRDQRTMVEFAEARGMVMPYRSGVAHDALEDARYQAECLQAIFQRWPEYYP
jgi:exodeoxyribonuclease VIII